MNNPSDPRIEHALAKIAKASGSDYIPFTTPTAPTDPLSELNMSYIERIEAMYAKELERLAQHNTYLHGRCEMQEHAVRGLQQIVAAGESREALLKDDLRRANRIIRAITWSGCTALAGVWVWAVVHLVRVWMGGR